MNKGYKKRLKMDFVKKKKLKYKSNKTFYQKSAGLRFFFTIFIVLGQKWPLKIHFTTKQKLKFRPFCDLKGCRIFFAFSKSVKVWCTHKTLNLCVQFFGKILKVVKEKFPNF
jgi:hypothetical protein